MHTTLRTLLPPLPGYIVLGGVLALQPAPGNAVRSDADRSTARPDRACIPSRDHASIQDALSGVGAEAVLCQVR